MIKNIIFDIGNVLLKFDYHPFVKELLKDDDVIEHVNNAIWMTARQTSSLHRPLA